MLTKKARYSTPEDVALVHQFAHEEFGIGGRKPWTLSLWDVIQSIILCGFMGGLFMLFSAIKFWIRGEDVPGTVIAIGAFAASGVVTIINMIRTMISRASKLRSLRRHPSVAIFGVAALYYLHTIIPYTRATREKSVTIERPPNKVPTLLVKAKVGKSNREIRLPIPANVSDATAVDLFRRY